jgi:hypothetical protein
MRALALFLYIAVQRAPKDPYILYFDAQCTEGDDNERVAETRDHRVRGWHGSDKLPSGGVGPRLIPSVDLKEFASGGLREAGAVIAFSG